MYVLFRTKYALPLCSLTKKYGLSFCRVYYNSFGVSSEHGGTHMGAPSHAADTSKNDHIWNIDDIPVEKLIGPALVIDVTGKAATNRDYAVTREDILLWERTHGKIESGSIFLMNSGWEKHYFNTTAFFGTENLNGSGNHYPGYHIDACKLLISRKVIGIGSDTASIDNGPSTELPCLVETAKANIWNVQMVHNIGQLPHKNTTLHAFPMKIGGGSGAPVRLVAVWPPENHQHNSVRQYKLNVILTWILFAIVMFA